MDETARVLVELKTILERPKFVRLVSQNNQIELVVAVDNIKHIARMRDGTWQVAISDGPNAYITESQAEHLFYVLGVKDIPRGEE